MNTLKQSWIKILGSAALALVLLAPTASATTLCAAPVNIGPMLYQVNCQAVFGNTFAATDLDFAGVLPVQGFYGGWGTLTNISVSVNASVDGVTTLWENDNTKSRKFTGNGGATVNLYAPGDDPLVDPAIATAFAAGPANWTFAAGTSQMLKTFDISASGSGGNPNYTPWSDFTVGLPGGQVSLQIEGLGGFTGTIPPGGFASFAGSASADAKVTYDYYYILSDVPEPMSMALLGSGLLLLGVFGRKRLARK